MAFQGFTPSRALFFLAFHALSSLSGLCCQEGLLPYKERFEASLSDRGIFAFELGRDYEQGGFFIKAANASPGTPAFRAGISYRGISLGSLKAPIILSYLEDPLYGSALRSRQAPQGKEGTFSFDLNDIGKSAPQGFQGLPECALDLEALEGLAGGRELDMRLNLGFYQHQAMPRIGGMWILELAPGPAKPGGILLGSALIISPLGYRPREGSWIDAGRLPLAPQAPLGGGRAWFQAGWKGVDINMGILGFGTLESGLNGAMECGMGLAYRGGRAELASIFTPPLEGWKLAYPPLLPALDGRVAGEASWAQAGILACASAKASWKSGPGLGLELEAEKKVGRPWPPESSFLPSQDAVELSISREAGLPSLWGLKAHYRARLEAGKRLSWTAGGQALSKSRVEGNFSLGFKSKQSSKKELSTQRPEGSRALPPPSRDLFTGPVQLGLSLNTAIEIEEEGGFSGPGGWGPCLAFLQSGRLGPQTHVWAGGIGLTARLGNWEGMISASWDEGPELGFELKRILGKMGTFLKADSLEGWQLGWKLE